MTPIAPSLRRQRTKRETTADGKEAGVPRTERRDDSESYAVSKVVSRTVAPVGALKRISVAVLIDGTHVERDGKRVFVPRPQEDLDRLKELVKGAVGFSEARGDRIQIASVPLQRDATPAVARIVSRWGPTLAVRLLAVGFAAAMLAYVARPVFVALGTRPRPRSGRQRRCRDRAASPRRTSRSWSGIPSVRPSSCASGCVRACPASSRGAERWSTRPSHPARRARRRPRPASTRRRFSS
jgi:flagellar biosynthesis/type III secretory pathway M-ring protein FliF/YscJ